MAQSTGGPLYSGKITSVWGMRTTTTFTASYNGKGGNDTSTFESLGTSGPQIIIHDKANVSGNILSGSGRILEGGNLQSYAYQPASQIVLRGDLTYYRDGWRGSHQFQTGFFAAPRNTYDQTTEYVNDGFVLEEHRLRDLRQRRRRHRAVPPPLQLAGVADDAGGARPRLRRLRAGHVARQQPADDEPRRPRRFRQAQRRDLRHRAAEQQLDRSAARLLVPAHQGFAQRVARQLCARARAGDGARRDHACSAPTRRRGSVDEYDVDGDGRFETVVNAAARSASIADYEFADGLHQPYVDEFILGFRKQFPGQVSLDIAGIHRSYQDMWARVDVNGIYPSGPNQPFGGFGAIDPTRGIIFQQQNNSWSTLEYRAIEMTLAKNMSRNFQAMAGINRQWQHFGGTWNPTDPAKFIQPNTFASDTLLYMPRGNNEENSLPLTTGTTVHTYGPTWQKYSMRFGGSYQAPWRVAISASYTILAGPWSGPIVDQLAADRSAAGRVRSRARVKRPEQPAGHPDALRLPDAR